MLFIVLFLCVGCKKVTPPLSDQDLIASWLDLTLHITKTTPANSPTFASRCFGYFGLTMYESVVHGSETHNSLNGSLKDLVDLPLPKADQKLNWHLSLNAAQAEILRLVYIQTSDANKQSIDLLEKENEERIVSDTLDQHAIDNSKDFGKSIAQAIFEWSKTDGGHRGYLKNFDKKLKLPEFLGCWAPPLYAQSFSHHPLHPHWGKNRVFVSVNDSLPLPQIIPFDTMVGSPYYNEMYAVYEKGKQLTMEEKQTAIWWADDPDSTFTPPGHSVFLMKNALVKEKKNIFESAEIYGAVGMGLSDAYIKCWQWKYHYFSERPNTYINKYIDERYESFWPDPPFPSFPSGHAIQGSVAAKILSHYFGDNYSFTDQAHEGRYWDEIREVDFVGRNFNSFMEMSEQCANSRFLGGIHMPQDNRTGIEQGQIIGKNILDLPWKK
jgi:hypothetical protein